MSALSEQLRERSYKAFGPEHFELFAIAADEIERLEKAVVAERIACAAIASSANNYDNPMTANDVADAILARSNKDNL